MTGPFVHEQLLGTPVEEPKSIPSLAELAELRRTAVEDPRGLTRIKAVRRGMDYWEHVLIQGVKLARKQGRSWTQIADELGVTRQAVWKRFSKLMD